MFVGPWHTQQDMAEIHQALLSKFSLLVQSFIEKMPIENFFFVG